MSAPNLTTSLRHHSIQNIYEVIEPIEIKCHLKDDSFNIPEGFLTDLATSPWFGRWIVPITGWYVPMVVEHDYLVKFQPAGWSVTDINQQAKITGQKLLEYSKNSISSLEYARRLTQLRFIRTANFVGTKKYFNKYAVLEDKSIFLDIDKHNQLTH